MILSASPAWFFPNTVAVGWAISKALEVTYTHHHYTVGGQIHKQLDGGPQGLNTAVEASNIYMLLFDKRFLVLVKSLGLVVLLYLRYVDDISVVMPPIKPGWFYSREHNSLKFDPEHEYAQMAGDKRTMLVLRDIANTVNPNLSFTVDCPP